MIEDTQTRYNLLCMRMRARAETVCGNFPRPLATAAQVRAAEKRLGFQLPLILHHLYTTVSNGLDFFKPGYWFHGIADEWYASQPNFYTIESAYRGHGKRMDDATRGSLQAHPGAFVVLDGIPEGAVCLAELGGNDEAWLDDLTGQLWESSPYYDEDGEFRGQAYSFCAPSVEDWLERKLAAPPDQESAGLYQPPYLLTTVMRSDGKISEADIPPAVSLDDLAHEARTALRSHTRRGERMEQHMLHLRRMREQVVQTLYEVGSTWYTMVREVGAVSARELGSEEMLQQLANAEAEIYCVEWHIQQNGYLL
jgi:hypothetical protein